MPTERKVTAMQRRVLHIALVAAVLLIVAAAASQASNVSWGIGIGIGGPGYYPYYPYGGYYGYYPYGGYYPGYYASPGVVIRFGSGGYAYPRYYYSGRYYGGRYYGRPYGYRGWRGR